MSLELTKEHLQQVLVAPQALLVTADEAGDSATGAEWVFVQGRGDRLHAGVQGTAEASAAALADVPANWRWLVVPEAEASKAIERAAAFGHGVMVYGADGVLRIAARATPQPGIFIKRYPSVRKAWKQYASW